MPEFPYRTAENEAVPCNLCGGLETELLNERDRNGLEVRTCLCTRCG